MDVTRKQANIFCCALAICLIPLLLFMNGCRKTRRSGSSPPPQENIRSYLGLVLPELTADVQFYRKALIVEFVYARFDLPREELSRLLAQDTPFLPKYSDLKIAPRVLSEMYQMSYRDALPWWQIYDLKEPIVAKRSGIRKIRQDDWQWKCYLCTAHVSENMMRVYIFFLEE